MSGHAGGLPELADAEYILPLRWSSDAGLEELTGYLRTLSRWIRVRVVDGSPPELFARHSAAWQGIAEHCAPAPWPGRNGKVAGVMTGVMQARAPYLVLADDDVRYTLPALRRAVGLLAGAEIVRPQNYFTPLPWHARWDTARTLLNRAFGSDFPGTLAVRRAALLAAGGYDGDVLFENLELIRTMTAAGGREVRADDLFVARIPPAAAHFRGQRVRQAYDSLAQPGRLLAELALLPLIGWSLRRPARWLPLAGAACLLAELGRRRCGGAAVFPPTAPLWAPAWLLERAVCSWLAVALRLTGGVRYAGSRMPRAGTSPARLRRRFASPEPPAPPVRPRQPAEPRQGA
ncbi:glycosyltransferase family 2 protein [Arthrobacter mobilis]|uniref:glycosyltransferase family 2 protein n=1 Tax=Arthrobacter mobilis TaxID=2724944 RepID=UPI001FE760CE|nr:glycosyltransferase family 2 protein [Arthrobacter mobilis]